MVNLDIFCELGHLLIEAQIEAAKTVPENSAEVCEPAPETVGTEAGELKNDESA
ncbi:MAG: hypothetical protein JW953_02055 [Anaerolineae bacterium]|nr:hypothetical protein [Anaerolineae bacterium]